MSDVSCYLRHEADGSGTPVMLDEREVAAIANEVLRGTLGQYGFDRATVRLGEDHDGEQAIFVTASFHRGAQATPGAATIASISGLSNALRARGENRFAYDQPRFVDDRIGAG